MKNIYCNTGMASSPDAVYEIEEIVVERDRDNVS
jgi:hypothetical protein